MARDETMPTVLVFPASFSQSSFAVPTGTQITVGTVNVSNYSQIRVYAAGYVSNPTNVQVLLTFTSGAGGMLAGQLDTLTLTPGGQITTVYDVPGTFLYVILNASPGKAGQDEVVLLIFGN